MLSITDFLGIRGHGVNADGTSITDAEQQNEAKLRQVLRAAFARCDLQP
jgi:hypothetical protein